MFHHYRTKGMRHGVVVRKGLKTGLAAAALTSLFMLMVQLAYPSSRALPQTRIGGKSYGYQSKEQIVASIAALNEQKLTISSGPQTLVHTPAELGLALSGVAEAEQATNYSWRERLVPFSLLFEQRQVPRFSFTIDEVKAKQFAATLTQYNKAPVDAVVNLEGAKVVVVQQQDGYAYEPEHMLAALKQLKLTANMHTALQPKTVQPGVTDQMAVEAATSLQQRLQKPITVKAGGKSVTADPALLASWVVVTPDAQHKKLHLNYDKEKIKQWLAQFAPQIYVAGTPRTTILLDDEVTGGANPADGQALDVEATAAAVMTAASANQPAVEGKVVPVIQSAQVIRNYTRSSKGLQALLNYWNESNAGTWGIVLKDFGNNVSASINPDRQFVSASVYKLYIAYVVYTKVDSGEIGMDSFTSSGNTVSGCLDLMIVRSDNDCGWALGDMIGWESSDGLLHAKGFTSTSLAYGGRVTTAQDAASYLMQLENGALLSPANRVALLHKMHNNIYRYAIPAGSPGMAVANKLGVRGAYSNDVAIVYHPKGTYVLSVFSYGSSHADIRELARQIAVVMNQ
jgi:beta-lactamase class A